MALNLQKLTGLTALQALIAKIAQMKKDADTTYATKAELNAYKTATDATLKDHSDRLAALEVAIQNYVSGDDVNNEWTNANKADAPTNP